MNEKSLLTDIDKNGRATITINRPAVHNAFDDSLIFDMTDKLKQFEKNPKVRIVVLASNGKNFSAGADLNWMKSMADYNREENIKDAMELAKLMKTLDSLSKPTIARVQGAAFGGGVGLVACCDIVIASRMASFSLSEVKLGLIPAVISPYVVNAIGSRAARRYFITAERFNAEEAHRLGLVHEVVSEEELSSCVSGICDILLQNGPRAICEAKKLVAEVARGEIDDNMITKTADWIAWIRASDEGKEGLSAFLGKRKPNWIKG